MTLEAEQLPNPIHHRRSNKVHEANDSKTNVNMHQCCITVVNLIAMYQDCKGKPMKHDILL